MASSELRRATRTTRTGACALAVNSPVTSRPLLPDQMSESVPRQRGDVAYHPLLSIMRHAASPLVSMAATTACNESRMVLNCDENDVPKPMRDARSSRKGIGKPAV